MRVQKQAKHGFNSAHTAALIDRSSGTRYIYIGPAGDQWSGEKFYKSGALILASVDL
jgi:hypothetical protein